MLDGSLWDLEVAYIKAGCALSDLKDFQLCRARPETAVRLMVYIAWKEIGPEVKIYIDLWAEPSVRDWEGWVIKE